ncbi:hypothetical protein CWI38_0526p0010 [Hamiltosporidium tvaerminnensis]|uniref:Uncharacterized protein n=2 Tax=Hamiltosporidium TaxID=1176354 RepID=A0A4Q9LWR1_9MICR|nr:hypothetical protein CWI38_0526p0010 [Hamiltosporidium tvaerminnensis]
MKISFSFPATFTFLLKVFATTNQRNNKRVLEPNSIAQNSDDYPGIDGFDYLSFAKVFLTQSDPIQPQEIETSTTEFLLNKQESFQANPQTSYLHEDYIPEENIEISSFDNASLHITCSDDNKTVSSIYSPTPLPAFHIAFPEKARKEQISEHFEEESMKRDVVNKQFNTETTCSQPIINDLSTLWSEEVSILNQEFQPANIPVEIQINRSIPYNVKVSEIINDAKFCFRNNEILVYEGIKNSISDEPSFNCFMNQIISERNLDKVNQESVQVIKQELHRIIFSSDSVDNCTENKYTDDGLDEENILFKLKDKNSEFYRNEYETYEDLKTILKFRRKLVKFENTFFPELATSEWAKTIEQNMCVNPLENIKKSKINLIFPELNLFFESFKANQFAYISKGHILYVHYLYEIMSLLTYSIFQNNESFLKNKSKDEISRSKILMNRRIFFMRILISELFISFEQDILKVQIYLLLNLLHYFSTLTLNRAVYFNTLLFKIKIRYIFRFIFDTNIKTGEDFKNSLLLGLIYQLKMPNASKLLQRGLFDLFLNNFCVPIYIDSILALINIYRDKFGKVSTDIVSVEGKEIKNLHQKINLLNFSQNTQTHDSRMLEIFLELECRISNLERRILRGSIQFMSFYAKRGYASVYKSILKQAELYYRVSN